MKKFTKPVESSSVRIYENIMRRLLLNNAALLLAALLTFIGAPVWAAGNTYFVVLTESMDLQQNMTQMEKMGVRIHHVIPPRIMQVEMPSGVKISQVSGIKSSYSSVVPIAEVESLGSVAIAAAIQWNKSRVSQARASSRGGISALAASVSRENLPAPTNLQVRTQGRTLSCSWNPVRGGQVYAVQMAADPEFTNVLSITHTDRTTVVLPVRTVNSVFVRVRAVERPDANDASADLTGVWTSLVPVALTAAPLTPSGSALTLTSPVEGMESTGFSVVLEWIDEGHGPFRIQVSKSASFDTAVIDEVVDVAGYGLPSSAFHVGDNLYWRVQTWSETTSPWSSTRTFKIGAPRSHMNDVFINPESPR